MPVIKGEKKIPYETSGDPQDDAVALYGLLKIMLKEKPRNHDHWLFMLGEMVLDIQMSPQQALKIAESKVDRESKIPEWLGENAMMGLGEKAEG